MEIPRRLGPESGPRRVLPDFTRSVATIERMLRALDDGPHLRTQERPAPGADATGVAGPRPLPGAAGSRSADAAARGPVRVTVSAVPVRTALRRAAAAVLALWAGLAPAGLAAALLLQVPAGHAPGVVTVALVLVLGIGALCLGLAGLRWAVLALAAVRARIERDEQGVRVVGAFGSRRVPWGEIMGVDSRAVHPVHGVSAALLLRGGGRVVMPLFDRPLWSYARPSGREIRELRAELARRHRKDGQRPWKHC